MGLFSKKHKDEPNQQPITDAAAMNSPQHSSSVHTNPTLPNADHTLQSVNIDGILPATTESVDSSPVSSYTGFQESPAPSVPNDDQNDYIMDPVPGSSPVQDDPPQDEPIYQEEPQVEQTEELTQPSEPVNDQPEPEEQPIEQPISEPELEKPDEALLSVNIGDPTPRHTDDDDLASLKAEALKQLTPLAQHLDQSPEEKFHTTMMMLQATDDQNLVKVAYAAANAITDEKARAQALLDVINEINYFTQNK